MKHFISKVTNLKLRLTTFLVSLLLWVNGLLASQTSTSIMTFPPQEQRVIYSNDIPKSWDQSLRVDDSNLDLGVHESRTDLLAYKELAKNKVIYLGAGFDRAYNTSINTADLLSSPYTKSDTLQISSGYSFQAENNNWGGFATGNLDLATTDQAYLSDGFSMMASAGASYAINPKLKFSFGLLTTRNLANRSHAVPIIGIDWDITEKLKLRTLNGAFLTYDLTQSTQMDLSVQYRDQAFAIENMQGTVFMKTDEKLALLEESSVVGTFGVRHNWKDVFSIRAFAEIVGQRQFEIVLEEQVEIPNLPEKDKAISFGVEGGIRF